MSQRLYYARTNQSINFNRHYQTNYFKRYIIRTSVKKLPFSSTPKTYIFSIQTYNGYIYSQYWNWNNSLDSSWMFRKLKANMHHTCQSYVFTACPDWHGTSVYLLPYTCKRSRHAAWRNRSWWKQLIYATDKMGG